jgi:RNA polymerase sigma factor (sigma-70 family)
MKLSMTEQKDSRTVAELFELYSSDILRYAFSILRDIEEARDVLQDVFLKYQNHEKNFKRECNYKTWLFTITRNTCYNRLKALKNVSGIEEMDFYPVNEVNIDDLISLNIALNRLSPEENELIFLKDFEKYSYKEIAVLLGLSFDNVRVKLFRAKKKLRKMFEEE